ncbi:MAG: sugar O-acetyltransferase [Chitinophagaceae bacterium]|nr:MAG: sugar O-acetyltransferase [Chitinophagaceae bacterium]
MTKDIFKRLLDGELVSHTDPEFYKLQEGFYAIKPLLNQINNATSAAETRQLFGAITGSNIDNSVGIFTPLQTNYGKNIKLGKNIFINFNCTFLDLGGIRIDDGVMIAPNVNLLSEGHPIEPAERHFIFGKPIHIKENAWIGGNVTILPGVTIGKNAIVAAGSVVNKDVPDNTIVGGIPAKVIKMI